MAMRQTTTWQQHISIIASFTISTLLSSTTGSACFTPISFSSPPVQVRELPKTQFFSPNPVPLLPKKKKNSHNENRIQQACIFCQKTIPTHHHLFSLPFSFSQSEKQKDEFDEKNMDNTSITNTVNDNEDDEPWGGWVAFGLSFVYLSHFSSLYTQLPGLYGPAGLLPISSRLLDVTDRCWFLQYVISSLPSPEFGMELFALLGIAISSIQIIFGSKVRNGVWGVCTYALLWILWHDLVAAGGRFTSYQMDSLLIDAGFIAILAASNLVPKATTFAYRWLLTRLYLGAGAVKLLSCDASWRNLSAVHWHFQSQPLPNILGGVAYQNLPNHIFGEAVTLGILVTEMGGPFLFLSPLSSVRRVAFVMNNVLMGGIMLFGNFGPLQVLLMIVGIALLDEDVHLPTAPGSTRKTITTRTESSSLSSTTTLLLDDNDESADLNLDWAKAPITAASLALSVGATVWTIHNIYSSCSETWNISPLIYDSIILAVVSFLFYSSIDQKNTKPVDIAVGLVLILGSSVPLTREFGLPPILPSVQISSFLSKLNPGATSYGLFAIMTGADGTRPTLSIMASYRSNGPWEYVPLLYQVNDPTSTLPLCFPHFPRLDWTLWFVPLGEPGGSWFTRFMHGIVTGDSSVLHLIDWEKFQNVFPHGPPEFVKLDVSGYEFVDNVLKNTGEGDNLMWITAGQSPVDDGSRIAHVADIINGIYSKEDFTLYSSRNNIVSDTSAAAAVSPWPSIIPLFRSYSDFGRPEWFIWSCILFSGITQATRSRTQSNEEDRGVMVDAEAKDAD